MDRRKIEDYFTSLAEKDFRLTLEPMREACHLLNNPQESTSSVHIAGTNGKGSTAAFLNTLLQKAGYRTGLITSPHLTQVTERIQINRQMISWEALSEVLQKIQSLLPDKNYLSYFEMITLAGFEYFAQREVDIAVVEVGMGGRLDATNVLRPQVTILTPIAFDHEGYLGDTLIKIAQEKCGILKPEMTVVSAPQATEVATVIEKKCEQLEIELIWANPEEVTTPLGLKGDHQKINAACALAGAKILLSNERVEEISAGALAETFWPGRLQYIRPEILVDGAHNMAGIETLARYLKKTHPDQKITFLVGALKDKQWETMFRPCAGIAKSFFCITPNSPRALPADVLAKQLIPFGKPVSVLARLTDLPAIHSPELLVATGSLYVVGELLKYVSTDAPQKASKNLSN